LSIAAALLASATLFGREGARATRAFANFPPCGFLIDDATTMIQVLLVADDRDIVTHEVRARVRELTGPARSHD
jgi:hypothetical protein